ncbi:MAG: MerR family transcriptional regulator [Clostridia bacterium]|nr:MerR family transcriptional regulator [Clostridia bacterium]
MWQETEIDWYYIFIVLALFIICLQKSLLTARCVQVYDGIGVDFMKKLSEVCKLVGVTRRTLQEYNKINLLKPTYISDSGYWYYDDNAIGLLLMIRIFLEAGYDRLAIKELFNSSIKDNEQVFSELLGSLEEKKKRIDGMIKFVRMLNVTLSFPRCTLSALDKIDLANIYQEKSFLNVFNDSVNTFSNLDETEQAEVELIVPLTYHLIAIANNSEHSISSEEVEMIFKDLFLSFKKIVLAVNETDESPVSFDDSDVAGIIIDWSKEMKSDIEISKLITSHSNEKGLDYVVRVLDYYCKEIINSSKIKE